MNIILKIELLSDWHCGSGLSAGADLDALSIKDELGFPFIPGKTIKGLLHEAAKVVSKDTAIINEIFGNPTNRENSDKEITDKGKCYFSNAELSKKVKESAKDKTELLFRKISSTKIDKKGIAEEHSLRRMEVAVPLSLYAEIADIPSEDAKNILVKSMKYIKRLGTNRNRGLGRCVITEVK